MSATFPPPSAPPTPPTPPTTPASTPPTFVPSAPRQRRSAGRRVAIWLGSAIALFGALLTLTGGAIFAVFGSDGVLATDRHELSTPTSALVSETASIDDTAVVNDVLGDTRITIDAQADGGRPVFVGVGRTADVDRYLAGAATDVVTDFDAGPFDSDFGIQRDRHAGSATPAAPGEQSFWVARSTSQDSAEIDWKVRDGDYRVVVMNADGSRGVATQTKFGVDVPFIPGVGIGILIAGLLLTAAGITSIALGARRPRAEA
jgi:hypothetical protein